MPERIAACTCARLSGDPGSYPCPVHPEFGAATFAGPVVVRTERRDGPAHDVQALRDLAQRYRVISRRNAKDLDLLLPEDPGPHMTALQLEWAAREIERLREEDAT